MTYRSSTRGVLFLAAVLLATTTSRTLAQDLSYSLLFGFGQHSWSGPFIEGGKAGVSLAAVAAELAMSDRVALRAELGGGPRRADLGRTGLFEEKTTLSHYRVHVGVLGRWYVPVRPGRIRFFVEAGATGWRRTACDVDTVGGPGFLGGETVDCVGWAPDGASDAGILPNNSGVTMLLGAGGYYRRFGLGFRYDAGGRAALESTDGPLRVRTLAIVGEWVFSGRS
jgi:hypothetical protein